MYVTPLLGVNVTRVAAPVAAVSRIRKLRVGIIRRKITAAARIELFWGRTRDRSNTRRKWRHERMGINVVGLRARVRMCIHVDACLCACVYALSET